MIDHQPDLHEATIVRHALGDLDGLTPLSAEQVAKLLANIEAVRAAYPTLDDRNVLALAGARLASHVLMRLSAVDEANTLRMLHLLLITVVATIRSAFLVELGEDAARSFDREWEEFERLVMRPQASAIFRPPPVEH